MSVLESTIGHVAEALVVAAAQHIEESLIVRAVGRKAELMARAGHFHTVGLEDLASSLLGRVEGMDAQKPLASIIPVGNGVVEMVRMPEGEVLEGAARYLAIVRQKPESVAIPRTYGGELDSPANARTSRPSRRRSS